MEQDPSLLEEETVIKEHTRKKKAAHEELFKGLKVEKAVIPLPEEDQICPVCGTQMVLIGEEYVRRELEFIPATCKVIEYYSQSYGCPSCKEGLGDTEKPVIIKSQVPTALVGKGPASASTVAWTMYQKYANGLPLYRQEKDWKQYGAQISRTTLANWIIYCWCSFTNNLSENAIRPFAVGRKNWLFSSSVDASNASAVVYTMVEMAKAHGLNIYGYLKFLLEHRPDKDMTDKQLAELAPWSEKLQSIKNRM